MKKTIIAILMCLSFSSFAQTYPWPDGTPCGRHMGVNVDGKLIQGITQYNWYSTSWKEIIDMMAELLKKPGMKLSFEYMQYRAGFQIMKREVDHGVDCQSLPPIDEKTQALLDLQEKRSLTKDDFTGSQWIHTLQALDVEEVNCLAMSKVNGKLAGCGDVWQDGITEDEALCIQGKTYIKCHVDCLLNIYDREIESQPGYCND